MMKKILVVDDDENMRNALSRILIAEGYSVILAAGGLSAQMILSAEDFDAVISDIQMSEGNGIELTRSLKQSKPQIPIILMTGFSEIVSAEQAYKLGANEFIPKPFHREELTFALNACLEKADYGQLAKNYADEYCKLSITDFVSGQLTPADVYICLAGSKFVKIAYKGNRLPLAQLEKFKSHGMIYLYMKKDAFREYMGFNLTLGKELRTDRKISNEKKLNFMKHTGEVVMEHLFLNGINQEAFDVARTIMESSVSLLTDENSILSILQLLDSHSDQIYAHSLGVSLYGVMLARQLHWNSPPTLFKVSTGGLLHDIGKKELSRELLQKKRMDMTREEIKLYESHPLRGLKILSEVSTISSDILQIVSQHHENCLGKGFPAGLTRHHIHPLARLISVVDVFSNLTLGKKGIPGMSIKAALEHMIAVEAPMLDKEMLHALICMCGGDSGSVFT